MDGIDEEWMETSAELPPHSPPGHHREIYWIQHVSFTTSLR